jgi:quinol monooxygenase YgiN
VIITVLEATLAPGREKDLERAYTEAITSGRPPAGLVHTELIRDVNDPSHWRIQTWWSSREALQAMRATGTPAGILIFRAAGAEPAVSMFEVVDRFVPSEP